MFSRLIVLALLVLTACPNKKVNRPWQEPSADELKNAVVGINNQVQSFQTGSEMEYWVNGERVKGEVQIMGKKGSFVRINALNPTGGDVAVDLACNGANYQMVNKNNNCQLAGPCDRQTISNLLSVDLAPDELLLMAAGGLPVMDGEVSTRIVWDKNGFEILVQTKKIADATLVQRTQLRKHQGHWEVVGASLVRIEGGKESSLWKLEHKKFGSVETPWGKVRLPSRSRFTQPKAELTVRWANRKFNHEISEDKFWFEAPPGLPYCGT